jgi:hypothetical protein
VFLSPLASLYLLSLAYNLQGLQKVSSKHEGYRTSEKVSFDVHKDSLGSITPSRDNRKTATTSKWSLQGIGGRSQSNPLEIRADPSLAVGLESGHQGRV